MIGLHDRFIICKFWLDYAKNIFIKKETTGEIKRNMIVGDKNEGIIYYYIDLYLFSRIVTRDGSNNERGHPGISC